MPLIAKVNNRLFTASDLGKNTKFRLPTSLHFLWHTELSKTPLSDKPTYCLKTSQPVSHLIEESLKEDTSRRQSEDIFPARLRPTINVDGAAPSLQFVQFVGAENQIASETKVTEKLITSFSSTMPTGLFRWKYQQDTNQSICWLSIFSSSSSILRRASASSADSAAPSSVERRWSYRLLNLCLLQNYTFTLLPFYVALLKTHSNPFVSEAAPSSFQAAFSGPSTTDTFARLHKNFQWATTRPR